MANDAEKKNISRLDFNINDAINSLEQVNQKLENLSKTSEAYAQKIGKNLKSSLDFGNLINAEAISKELSKVANITESDAKKLVAKTMSQEISITANAKKEAEKRRTIRLKATTDVYKSEVKTADKIKVIEANTASYREKRAADMALAQEKANLRVLNSTRTVYDKITEYAKTYIIYQGFNELKRGVKETIEEMVEMEYQMVQIDRVLNDNSLNIDIYRDKLIQMAQDYANSFENVADITLRLAQAGYNADESLALTEKTLLALNTAELDATQATDDMVAVMAQWGLMTGTASEQAENYGNIIDKINKVADNFPTTSADILDALKKTSSAFNLAGASIDETIATIVAAEKASQRGGKVIGTALSNIIQQLKAENKLDLAEELGLNFFKDAKKTEFRPVMEIFQEMSEMMQNLKDQGKESSVEMQGLLEMFTVFRRNIGASLLSEMAGEDSTYAQVLTTSIKSVGYSLQENTKHMKTAKAAQAQFNAELLKLKTQVWEGGLEDLFRDFLSFGKDFVGTISNIIDKFGVLPTAIGTVTMAYTALNKSIQGFTYNSETNSIQLNGFFKTIADGTKGVREANAAFRTMKDGQIALTAVQGRTLTSYAKNTLEIAKYTGSLVLATAKTITLQVATIALNAALSMGISYAITLIISKIDEWSHATERAVKANEELMEKSKDNANTMKNEATTIRDLRKEYEELAKKDNRTTEENQKIYELQEKLNQLIKDTGTEVELVTTKINEQGKEVTEVNTQYDIQIQKIKELEREKEKARVRDLKIAADAAVENLNNVNDRNLWEAMFDWDAAKVKDDLRKAGVDLTKIIQEMGAYKDNSYRSLLEASAKNQSLDTIIDKATPQEQYKILNNVKTQLEQLGKTGGNAYRIISDMLQEVEEKQKVANQAVQDYNDALKDLYDVSGLLVDYQTVLSAIMDTYGENESVKNLATDLTTLNSQFANGKITTQEYFEEIKTKIESIDFAGKTGKELEGLQAIFAETTRFISSSLEDIQNSFDDDEITFKNYVESLADANENLLELYATQYDLKLNSEGVWEGANEQAVEYANNLQKIQDEAESFIGVLDTLGKHYDYIAENADEYGNAAFEAGDMVSQKYKNLATEFGTSLAQMRQSNEEAWKDITQHIFDNAGKQANEIADVDAYVINALKTNNTNLNTALNQAAKKSQEAATKLATNTGDLVSALGDVIKNFKYDIKFKVSGSIDPGGNILNLATGKSFKPTSDLTLSVSGSAEEGSSVENLADKLKNWGQSFNEYNSTKNELDSLLETISPYVSKNTPIVDSPRKPNVPSAPSGGKDKTDEQAAREAEEAYKKRLKAFEDYIDNKEEDEEKWVKRQKELGLLSNKDYMYITQQRIERHKKYLEEVKNATWMNEEDKLKLQREYSEKIKDLEIDYLGYLKDEVDEEIKTLEDANKEKIKLIEEEAEAKINALKKVEDARDRDRETEEYQKERQSILEEISYWEQRTGREAQEALKEAKEKLAELDAEWEDTQEDWSIEDQIKQIEEEKDAEIAAIQATQEAEIKAMQDVYDAKVKMFVETGEIIYEGSVIQAQSLYNAYKANFIDPISSELANLNKTAATTTNQTQEQKQEYETYTIKSGDTLSKIARKYGTTVEKLMAANPYITNKNKIFAGKTLQIPKFHEGGIVGGNQEAFALLKPHEVILKPEWADGINKLAKMAKANESPMMNNTVVEVKGDLVRIDAKINDKTDAEYLTRRIEKMLKDKFNIKK